MEARNEAKVASIRRSEVKEKKPCQAEISTDSPESSASVPKPRLYRHYYLVLPDADAKRLLARKPLAALHAAKLLASQRAVRKSLRVL